MRVQFGLALECREIIVAMRFLPFFFFVAFVVILLVAANGCSMFFRGYLNPGTVATRTSA